MEGRGAAEREEAFWSGVKKGLKGKKGVVRGISRRVSWCEGGWGW